MYVNHITSIVLAWSTLRIWDKLCNEWCRLFVILWWMTSCHRPPTYTKTYLLQTVQRLMLSKGAKRTIFYHITVILQYFWNKTIAWSGDMYRDDLGIFSLAIKCFGITNTSWQNFAVRIASVKTVLKCLRKLEVLWTNLINIYHL